MSTGYINLPVTGGASATLLPPTIQKFLSGSGTYTRPTPAPLYIQVIMCGGGGGGSGGNGGNVDPSMTKGTDGGNSTFGTSLLVANGGIAPEFDVAGPGGAGGTASLGTGPVGDAYQGGSGGGPFYNGSVGNYPQGALGGLNPLVGNGGNSLNDNNASPIANTGAGGPGGASGADGNFGGFGGGAGGYINCTISGATLAATFPYSVGAGGTGGDGATPGDFPGSSGASGVIKVIEFYQ